MTPAPSAARPLKHTHYLLLLALSAGDLHGYGLKKEIARLTNGGTRVGAGSLYRAIGQLLDRDLIARSDWRPATGLDDERRVYYRITEKGRQAATAETERLAHLVAEARTAGLG
jgi:DNA-binding PadR family transcriptional regulator